MSIPWIPEVSTAELLPDDTKWEEHDEFTLWKQCKLRGLDGGVKKEGDALRLLKGLNLNEHFEVRWLCRVRQTDQNGVQLSTAMAWEKAFASLIRFTETHTFHIFRVEERDVPESSMSEMVIEISDATVRLGYMRRCSCDLEFYVGFATCKHILYLELHVMKCPRRLHRESYLDRDELTEYFANAPPAFKPREFVGAHDLNYTISDKNCQLCFKQAKPSGDVNRCQVCCRVAHQQCHEIYRTRKGACEGNMGCALCCPHCPWNPSNPDLKTELLPMEVKEEPWTPREGPATTDEGLSRATKLKVRKLEKQVRRLRCQLHRKPASRVMSSLRYERLVGKIGRKSTKYRRHQLAVVAKEALKSEDSRPKDEDKAAVFKEEMESPVKIIKVEKTKKVESEPVVISLL